MRRHQARALAFQARRQYAPNELHDYARAALNRITTAGPEFPWPDVHRLDSEFPWQSYVACHARADEIIGSGIVLATAEFIADTRDPNRQGQPRLDFVFYRADGSYCRLHPGTRPAGANYRSASSATEQTLRWQSLKHIALLQSMLVLLLQNTPLTSESCLRATRTVSVHAMIVLL